MCVLLHYISGGSTVLLKRDQVQGDAEEVDNGSPINAVVSSRARRPSRYASGYFACGLPSLIWKLLYYVAPTTLRTFKCYKYLAI